MIYLDNAATTKTNTIALEMLNKYSVENFYNPSALYHGALENAKVLEASRKGILALLHGGDGEFIFTASGTEADNMALYCSKKVKNGKIIVSEGEHPAVMNPALDLKNKGYNVVFAPLNTDGSINIEEFNKLLSPDVSLVSIMHVSNETGAVNDIARLVKLTKSVAPKAVFHSDGVQALGKVKVNLLNLDVDMYSVSAHKVHAPRGVGGLYVKKGVTINPLILGGGQEKGLRSATENLAGITAFYEILKQDLGKFDESYEACLNMLKLLRGRISAEMPMHQIISPENAPHILTVALKGIRGEVMLHSLEEFGIIIGVGSACSSKKGINRFQTLLGLDDDHKEGIIRISVSEENTLDEINEFVDRLALLTEKLANYKRI